MRAAIPIALAIVQAVLAAEPASAASSGEQAGRDEVNVLFISGLGGHFVRPGCEGDAGARFFATVAANLSSLRARLPGALVIGAGNMAGPSAFSRWLLERKQGAQILVGWLRAAGVDFLAFGSEEVLLVPRRLSALLEAGRAAGLDTAIANLDCPKGSKGICELVPDINRGPAWFERGGRRLAVISLVAAELASEAMAEPDGAAFAEPLLRANFLAEQARSKGADAVIVVADLDDEDSFPSRLYKLALGAKGIDLIIGASPPGKQSQVLNLEIGTTPVVMVPALAGKAGLAHISFAEGKSGHPKVKVDVIDIATGSADAGIEKRIEAARASYCTEWGKPLRNGRLLKPLDAKSFRRLVLELMRMGTDSDLAFVDSALVADSGFPITGALTKHDVYASLPRRNRLVTFTMGQAELEQLCNRLTIEKKATGGLRIDFAGLDCGPPVKVNGRPVAGAVPFRVVALERLLAASDGYFEQQRQKAQPYTDPAGRKPLLGQLVRKLLDQRPGMKAIGDPEDIAMPERKLRWSTTGTLDVQFSDTHLDNTAGYEQSQLTREQVTAVKGSFRGKLMADSNLHAMALSTELRYARSATAGSSFLETDDLATVNFLYRLDALKAINRWIPSPYFEGNLETEFTKPDDRDFHHLELTATVGARLGLLPTLEVKAGFGVRDEVYDPALPYYLFELGAELSRTDLVTILGSPLQLESKLLVSFGDVGRTNTLKATWSNRLYFAISGPLFFTVTHEWFIYRESDRDYAMASDLTFGLSATLSAARQTY